MLSDYAIIDEAAKKNAPLPDNAGCTDRMLYHTLRAIYAQYQAGALPKPQAMKAKQKALSDYKELSQWEKIFDEEARQRKEIAAVIVEANKHGCEICKRIARIYDNRERK